MFTRCLPLWPVTGFRGKIVLEGQATIPKSFAAEKPDVESVAPGFGSGVAPDLGTIMLQHAAQPEHRHWVTHSPALPLRQIKQTRQFWVSGVKAIPRL